MGGVPGDPDAVVIVATVRALKMHGGLDKKELDHVDMAALEKGLANLTKHIENIQKFGLPAVVAVNAFPTDTKEELDFVEQKCNELGAEVALSEVWAKGGEGGLKLAEKVDVIIENIKPGGMVRMGLDYEVVRKLNPKVIYVSISGFGSTGPWALRPC